MFSRRSLLSGAAPAVAALGLAGCAGTLPPVVVGGGLNPAFIDAVVAYLQQICPAVAYIPTAESIADVVATLFGGAAAIPIIQTIGGSVQAVASELCSAVPATASARLKLKRRLAGHTQFYGQAVFIGISRHKVVINGYEP